MNLQEALYYRNNCVICQREMILYFKPKGTWVTIKPDGLKIKSSKNAPYYLFGFDGKITKNNKGGAHYKSPLLFSKRCKFCDGKKIDVNNATSLAPIMLKSRSLGYTTMSTAVSSYYKNKSFTTVSGATFSNIKDFECYYTFCLELKEKDEFDVNFLREQIKYPSQEAFHHVYTDFIKDTTTFSYGFFSKPVTDVLNLESSSKMLNQIKTKEDLISKFKLYQLFS